MKFFKNFLFISLISIAVLTCAKNENKERLVPENDLKELTIFHINDQHGRIDNFAKIKHIVDEERSKTNVLLVCAGDIFSGNPVVDNHENKGFPMIDLMNKVGFDISVIGNHEFDYGQAILKDRMQESQFAWVCANVDMNTTSIPEPHEYKTITENNIKVTFLGLVETHGKENAIIPSTHPWRVQNITFRDYSSIIDTYAQVKNQEQSDLYVALTHLGTSSDEYIANNHPYFDLIIGGHSHTKIERSINQIPIFQAGSNLNYLGKISLKIKDKKIENLQYNLIDLTTYTDYDAPLKEVIDSYNEDADLDEIIGFSEAYHSKSNVGSFYTNALRIEMNVDVSIQNTGGIRDELDQGDITKREIYSIDPFNNGSVTFTMTVAEIKNFLKGSKAAIYYSGVHIEQVSNSILIKNYDNEILNENTQLTIGLNDYIPAVYDTYFTQKPTYLSNTTAETIINYLYHNSESVNFSETNNYFRFE